MGSRTDHNRWNSLIFNFSGNEVHAYMDRRAKDLRQKHRDVGHDMKALVEMLALNQMGMKFKKLTPAQIMQAWGFHKLMDGMDSAFGEAVKIKNKNYGKKSMSLEDQKAMYQKLRKELLRY